MLRGLASCEPFHDRGVGTKIQHVGLRRIVPYHIACFCESTELKERPFDLQLRFGLTPMGVVKPMLNGVNGSPRSRNAGGGSDDNVHDGTDL
jgi:hypothetical protein